MLQNRHIRMNRHSKPLPSARKVRTELHTTGRVEDKVTFNVAAVHMMEFIHRDISVMDGPCDKDPRCIPIHVPHHDPYLKVTDIHCLNFSRAETFQDAGCTPEIILPEQINFQTPVIDLSTIYGVDAYGLSKVRTYHHGLLILENRSNRYVPANITYNKTYVSAEMLQDMKNNIISNIKDDMMIKLTMTMINKNYTVANMTTDLLANLSSDMLGSMAPNMPNMMPEIMPDNYNDKMLDLMPNIMSNFTKQMNMSSQMLVNMTADVLVDTIANILANSMVDMVSNMVTNLIPNATEQVCLQNNDTETLCYKFGFPEVGNYDLRTTALTIFFMREHNRLARALHKINPCWKDDRLFKVARQINIATASNIFMYELLPALLGFRNMVNYGVISENVEHLTTYDAEAVPLVYAEYDIAVRYFHTFLDGRVKTYTEAYHYKDEYSYSETMFRSGLLEKGNIFEELNRENYYGKLQKAHDLPALDIQRGRDMGVRGYNDYRHLCGLKPAKKFRDFIDVMEIEKVEALKRLYENVDDVDLLAGIMSENHLQGVHVGPTLFCIMTKQLQIFRFSDRFWFERGDQFHSFTLEQLQEIRRTSMARLACDNAEGIKYIQANAFMNVKPGNMPVPCTHIEGPDLNLWRDGNCHKHTKYMHEDTYYPYRNKNKDSFYVSNRDTDSDFPAFFDSFPSSKPGTLDSM
ncbi:unnamed protein product [Spodoptera littoralis]|uniref:Peroxidase n=1 Tax=Spodoptera littoralis TaxID=7109 RepID=A0A9P0HX93_SPOLI|nr:unnamed protein product [Spodoptera littoralis]CAH1635595.1 unnamed protein product [Spodoptera littoralis]